jgi:hypothetical protein
MGKDEGARNFRYSRKIYLANYQPKKKYESEEFACEHDSFEEARAVVEEAVKNRIAELTGMKEVPTKE